MTADPAALSRSLSRARARASGKVNLQLSVGAKGLDGYHPLVSIFQAVTLYETVTAQVRDDAAVTVALSAVPGYASDLAGIPTDERNLAVKAALALKREYGVSEGVDLSVLKGVPTAGGMAGGSADAAAALVACAHAWGLGASRDDLMRIGASLGADVPFCLLGHTAVGLGKGDQLSPAMSHGEFHWAFAVQAEGLATPEVFARFDEQIDSGDRLPGVLEVDAAIVSALIAADPVRLGAALRNDLQDAALSLMPKLHGVLDVAQQEDAFGVIVSGSGPTVAALAANKLHANQIAAAWRTAGAAPVVVTASGPATGAVVIDG